MEAHFGTGVFLLLGASTVIGLWWLIIPNSVIRLYSAQAGLFGLGSIRIRPWLIRLAGALWIAAPLIILLP